MAKGLSLCFELAGSTIEYISTSVTFYWANRTPDSVRRQESVQRTREDFGSDGL